MWKRISLSVASAVAAFCVFMLNSCVVAELINDGTTYYDAEITTYGNLVVTGRIGGQRSSQLPCGAKKISIKTENGREKIKSEQIKYLTLSRKKHPDNQQTLIYQDFKVPYTKKGVIRYRTYKRWQVLEHAGDNLLVTAYGDFYSLAKDGTLVVRYNQYAGLKYCIKRRDDDSLIFIGTNNSGRSYMRRQWQEYLSDDKVLCAKIANKDIDAFDFKAIVEQYTPGRK